MVYAKEQNVRKLNLRAHRRDLLENIKAASLASQITNDCRTSVNRASSHLLFVANLCRCSPWIKEASRAGREAFSRQSACLFQSIEFSTNFDPLRNHVDDFLQWPGFGYSPTDRLLSVGKRKSVPGEPPQYVSRTVA